jgi:hypothetical protein
MKGIATNTLEKILLNNVDLNDLLSLVPADKYKDDTLLYNCYLLNECAKAQLFILPPF